MTNLDWPVVDEKTIKLLESIAGSVRSSESHVGNAAAHTIGPIRQLNALDWSDSLDEVILKGRDAVSQLLKGVTRNTQIKGGGPASRGVIVHHSTASHSSETSTNTKSPHFHTIPQSGKWYYSTFPDAPVRGKHAVKPGKPGQAR